MIDSSRPCGSCSAPGPDQCPYVYLLADQALLDSRFGHEAARIEHPRLLALL